MFWKRKEPGSAPRTQALTTTTEEGAAPLSAEECLDALAEFLRIFGSGAFDLESRSAEQVREYCEAWARHLLVGIAPPGYPAEATEWQPGVDAPRDLPGLRRFVDETRREENRYLNLSLSNMLGAIWAFIGGLRHSLAFEQQSDEQVGHRLRRLESAARGNSTEQLKQEAFKTVDLVRQCMEKRGEHHQSLISSMGSRLEDMSAELSVVREQATCDSLTGLFNRASLDEHLERLVDLRNLFGRKMVLFMIDIDYFKWVNDTHGHATGDQVLCEVAGSLAESFLRKEDFVARFGGDEFAVVLQDGRMEVISTLTERCLHHLRNLEFEVAGESLRITASLGVAMLHEEESPASWLERADQALYEAKESGRDRIVIHRDDRR